MNIASPPMRFASEVENSILFAGLPDYDLAHGAALIADPTKFIELPPRENKELVERSIYGVTAISLAANGDLTFRTATFGTNSPAFINQLEVIGTDKVIGVGVYADKTPKSRSLLSSRLMLSAMHLKMAEGSRCTIGGVISHAADQPGTMRATPFISNRFDEVLGERYQSRAGRLSSGMAAMLSSKVRSNRRIQQETGGPDPLTMQKLGTFVMLASAARKRAGVVVVDRPFVARV